MKRLVVKIKLRNRIHYMIRYKMSLLYNVKSDLTEEQKFHNKMIYKSLLEKIKLYNDDMSLQLSDDEYEILSDILKEIDSYER